MFVAEKRLKVKTNQNYRICVILKMGQNLESEETLNCMFFFSLPFSATYSSLTKESCTVWIGHSSQLLF